MPIGQKQRAHGIDISKWDSSYNYARNPVDFVIQRLSYVLRRDELYWELFDNAQMAPIRGGYHYFSSGAEWKAQADHYLEIVNKANEARPGAYHFHNLDIEKLYNAPTYKFLEGAPLWMQYVKNETGVPVHWYSNLDVYNTWLKPNVSWMRSWPWWYARYFWLIFQSPDKDPGAPDGLQPVMWQYSADNPANNKGAEYGVAAASVDLNVWMRGDGSVADMENYLGINRPEPGPEPPSGPSPELIAWQASLNRRKDELEKEQATIDNFGGA